MPLLCGPLNSRFTYTGSPCPHLDLALPSKAATLGAALFEYETHFDVKIEPLAEPLDGNPDNTGKYFRVSRASTGHSWLVDIHVFRSEAELCPKQDLSFALLMNDVVEMGQLIC